MATIGNVISEIFEILEAGEGATRQADLAKLLGRARKVAAKDLEDGELREWVEEYCETWSEAKALADTAGMRDATTELLLELGNEGLYEDESP